MAQAQSGTTRTIMRPRKREADAEAILTRRDGTGKEKSCCHYYEGNWIFPIWERQDGAVPHSKGCKVTRSERPGQPPPETSHVHYCVVTRQLRANVWPSC